MGLHLILSSILIGPIADDASYPPLGEYVHTLSITERYERVRDDLTTTLNFGAIIEGFSHKVSLSLSRHSTGTKRTKGEVSLYFRSVSTDGWKYLKFHEISFLVDDERWSFEPDHDGDIEVGRVIESMFVHLPEKRFLKLVNAKHIEVVVGVDKYEFLRRDREALKDFASLIDSPGFDLANRVPKSRIFAPIDKKRIPEGEGVVSTGDEFKGAPASPTLQFFADLNLMYYTDPDNWEAYADEQKKKGKIFILDYGVRFNVIGVQVVPRNQFERKQGITADKKCIHAEILDGDQKGKTLWIPADCVQINYKPPRPGLGETDDAAAESKLRMARAHEKDGRTRQAIASYKEIVGSFPGTPQADEASKRLKEIVK